MCRISPGIAGLIKKLMANNIDVYLISGGFRQMINLGIPLENIFANQLLFGSSGEFIGFDAKEPTSRSGGKATAVQQIRKKFFLLMHLQVHNYKALVMIGDGATDLEVAEIWKGLKLFIVNVFSVYISNQMFEAPKIFFSPRVVSILQARKPGGADLFICYAGVQLREAVALKADWLIFDFEELITSL
ncbi:hypothetical protein BHE74_00012680 [Ensete ventricosum]|nr:hypothetical protein BHE74_00012680 [Ensete ventricosum]